MAQFQGQQNQGFTLIEILSVIVMVGVMAAIAAPGMLGFLARSKVDRAFANLQDTVTNTQRQAMKKSQECRVILPENETENGLLSSNCLITGAEEFTDIFIKYNKKDIKNITFNYRGGTSPLRTIVLYSKNTEYKRCLVISNGIGMTRKGVYTKNDLANISASHCKTTL
ncbi:MAG: type II secretion system protein [Limnothrix sp.]